MDKDKLKSLLECSICLEQYVEPKMLACTHEFCKLCIEQLLVFQEDGSAEITCPMRCKKTTKLQQCETVNDLAASYNFKNILEVMVEGDNLKKRATTSECSYTKKCKKKPVSVYCCGKLMCKTCYDKHCKSGSSINNNRNNSISSNEKSDNKSNNKKGKNNNINNNENNQNSCNTSNNDSNIKNSEDQNINEQNSGHQKFLVGLNQHENKLMILCDDHNTFCRSVCVDEKFLCLYCNHRDSSHKGHKKTAIEEEVDLLKKLMHCELSYRKWILRLKEITLKNIDEARIKFKSALQRRKEECLRLYSEVLEGEEAKLMGDFERRCGSLVKEDFDDVSPTSFCEEFLQKEDFEYIFQKENIFNEVAKNGKDLCLENLKMTYNDAVPVLSPEPMGKVKINAKLLPVKRMELHPTFQYIYEGDVKVDAALSSDSQNCENTSFDMKLIRQECEQYSIQTDLKVSIAFKVRGNELFKNQRYDEALNFYSKGIDLCPVNAAELATFYQNRAAVYEKLDDENSCMEDCNQALEIDPKYVKALQRRSRMNKSMFDYEESFDDLVAAKFFDTPENRRKYDFSIIYNSSFLRRLEERYADEVVKKIGTVSPQNFRSYLANFGGIGIFTCSSTSDALYSQIVSDLKKGRYDDMEKRLNKLIQMNGKHKNLALILRGSLRVCKNDFDNALKDLDMAIADLDDHAHTALKVDALSKRARLKRAYLLNESIGASKDFEEAKRLDCDNAMIYHNQAECGFYNDREVDTVLADYQKAISQDVRFIAPRLALGDYLFFAAKAKENPSWDESEEEEEEEDRNEDDKKSYMERAVETFEEAVRLCPRDREVLSRYGRFLMRIGKTEEALREVEKAISLAPKHPQPYVDKGNILLQKGNIMHADHLCDKALELDYLSHDALCLRGKIRLAEGQYEEAMSAFGACLALFPSSRSVLLEALVHREECEAMMKLQKEHGGQ